MKYVFSPILAKMFHLEAEICAAKPNSNVEYYPPKPTGDGQLHVFLQLDILNLTSNEAKLDNDTFYLSYNYFPTASSLVENLNKLVLSHINNMHEQAEDSKVLKTSVFLLDAGDICSFVSVPNFKIGLSTFLLNVLKLENTDRSNTATLPSRLPSATREQLYVHSNIVEGHLINNDEQQLLRVINNSATV